MARTTVRVDLPTNNQDELLKLIQGIIDQHKELNKAAPGSSPLAQKTIDALSAIVASAKPDRDAAKLAQAQADKLFGTSDKALGLAEGQTMRSEGTGLYIIGQIRDLLLATYRGQEATLETFGFNVVIGTAASRQRQPKPSLAKT